MSKHYRSLRLPRILALALILGPLPARAETAMSGTESSTGEARSAAIDEQSRKLAQEAHQAAASAAAEAVLQATRLDLDIRLIGHNSLTVVAGS